ncbi:MAG TPA: hypothetical protein DHU88_08610 [Pseudomonas sp.]|nr:hypothetical protein [Pseudomonas sp.]
MIAKDGLKHLSFVDEHSLPALYSGAAIFVAPSLDEGLGLPLLEAMRCRGHLMHSQHLHGRIRRGWDTAIRGLAMPASLPNGSSNCSNARPSARGWPRPACCIRSNFPGRAAPSEPAKFTQA